MEGRELVGVGDGWIRVSVIYLALGFFSSRRSFAFLFVGDDGWDGWKGWIGNKGSSE